MYSSHFHIDRLVWVCTGAVARGLFDELPPVSEDEGLGSMLGGRFDTVNELGENDLCIVNIYPQRPQKLVSQSSHFRLQAKHQAASDLFQGRRERSEYILPDSRAAVFRTSSSVAEANRAAEVRRRAKRQLHSRHSGYQ